MFGVANCKYVQDKAIAVQFKKINSRGRFTHLIEEFKEIFQDRIWDGSQWLIPSAQQEDLERFCKRRGLEINWKQTTQLKFPGMN